MLHGLGATGEVWQGLTDLIDRHNAGQWLVPDLRGHGRSAWGAPYTYESLADDLLPLIKDSGRVVVVGHSMGGVIALVLGKLADKPVRSAKYEVRLENGSLLFARRFILEKGSVVVDDPTVGKVNIPLAEFEELRAVKR